MSDICDRQPTGPFRPYTTADVYRRAAALVYGRDAAPDGWTASEIRGRLVAEFGEVLVSRAAAELGQPGGPER